jgi:hypothetical protein
LHKNREKCFEYYKIILKQQRKMKEKGSKKGLSRQQGVPDI